MISTCPCKDCEKRTSTCHSTCEDFLKWREELSALRKWQYTERLVNGASFSAYATTCIIKRKQGKKR